jgi:hypothetical protein
MNPTSNAVAEEILLEIAARIAQYEAVIAEGVITGQWLSDTRHGLRQSRASYQSIVARMDQRRTR